MVMTLLTRPKKTVATVVIATDGSGDYNTDGVDDDVQIQAAIDSLPAGGGCIYIKEGVYNISATITITTNNVALIGCGRSTQIQTNDDIIMLQATNVIGILTQNIYWYGAGAGNLGNVAINYFGTTSQSFIHHCWVENCAGAVGIIVFWSNDNEISDCYIANNFDDAINTAGARTRIINNYLVDNTGYGVYSEGNDSIILSNYCEGNNNGIGLRNCDNNIVSNNICIDSTQRGIFLNGSSGSELNGHIVSNNECNDNTYHGIYLFYADNCNVSDNICVSNDSENTTTYSGIALTNSDNNIVSNNRCQDNDNYEIDISNAGCSKNLVVGNHCIGTDHQGTINDASTNTQIFNNIES